MRNGVKNMFRAWYVPIITRYSGSASGSYHHQDAGKFAGLRLSVCLADFVRGVIELYQALRDDNEEQAVAIMNMSWGLDRKQ